MSTAAPIELPGAKPTTIAAQIRAAAETTGVPFEFLLAQASKESGFDPEAASARSTATGLFQFTQGTWLEMVKKHGAAHGLEHHAKAITRGKSGWVVADAQARHEILELRRDPALSAMMAAEYARDNSKVLKARLGRPVSAHDLTMAHLLGATGAARVLEARDARPDEPAAAELPKAARANPELFSTPGTAEPRSFASLHDDIRRRYDEAVAAAIPTMRRMETQRDLAALRPEGRPEDKPEDKAGEDGQLAQADHDGPQDAGIALPPPPRPQAFAGSLAAHLFPVTLPPPAIPGLMEEGRVLRLMLQAMES